MLSQIKLANVEIQNFLLIWCHQRNELNKLLCLMNLIVPLEVLRSRLLLLVSLAHNQSLCPVHLLLFAADVG